MPVLPDDALNSSAKHNKRAQNAKAGALDVLTLLRDKWRAPILLHLADAPDPLRYGDLCRALDGVSHTMLTRALQDLEALSLIKRQAFPEVPVRVEYQLTSLGRSLTQLLLGLDRWAKIHSQDLQQMLESLASSRSHTR